MARKVTTITIAAEGRDLGKTFQITEMSASATEEWAIRAFLALANTGVEIPEDLSGAGFAGIATMGVSALGKIPFEAAKPLLDQLLTCVRAIPDPTKPQIIRNLYDGDIEEAQTFLKLRAETWKLHTDFLFGGGPSASTTIQAA
jgi:hypothetical protein